MRTSEIRGLLLGRQGKWDSTFGKDFFDMVSGFFIQKGNKAPNAEKASRNDLVRLRRGKRLFQMIVLTE